MEFGFSAAQEKFRREMREFFLNELPSDYRLDHKHELIITDKQLNFAMQLQSKAGEKGYLAPGWSKESGGLGLGDIEQGIAMEEAGYWQICWPGFTGLRICGPALHLFGTHEQKQKFLPPIAQGKMVWYQAFTEPDAGSDEANVQLHAVPEGGVFVLNGQKVFITAAGPADYLYTLARTADVTPKHRGLSLFLVPAHSKGISYRPLPTMGVFTVEIFFDDVRVSKDNMVGELNRGFYHAMDTLMFERGGTTDAGTARRMLEEFVRYYKETQRNGKPMIEDPEVRKTLAELAMEAQIEWFCGWYGQWYLNQREKLGAQPYHLGGVFKKTYFTRRSEAMMNTFGIYGQLRRTSRYAKFDGRMEGNWQESRSTHPEGTLEINKNVIAQRGLGLPRLPRSESAKSTDK